MKILPIESTKLSLNEIIKMVKEGPILFTMRGEVRYAFIPVDEPDIEAFSLGSNPEFIAYLKSCRERAKKEGYTSIKDIRKKLGV